MPPLNEQQIAQARLAKSRYLLSFLGMVSANLVNALVRLQAQDSLVVVSEVLMLIALGFGLVMTWRFCRAIGIGLPMTIVSCVLAPFGFIIELIVLLRIYARRTGVQLTFLLGDKPRPATAA